MKPAKLVSLTIAIAAGLIALLMSPEYYHINGLSVVEQRVIAIFIFAAMAIVAAGVSLMDQGAFVIPDELSLILLLPPIAAYLISWRISIALYKKRAL